MQSTSVRIDVTTHQELKRLAAEMGTTVGETVALAVRRLRQDRIGEELTAVLTPGEVEWLDADLGLTLSSSIWVPRAGERQGSVIRLS
ncbi:MAG: hypothetical protein ACRDXD_10000 [Acidimicrobiia bacterium]